MAITDLEQTGFQPPDYDSTGVAQRAAEMVADAVGYCESKSVYQGRDQVGRALRAEIPQVHDYFRYSLTRQLASYLSGLDESVVGVYSLSYGDAEEEGEDRSCSVTASLSLLLHVRRKTAALSSVIASLDQALLAEYRKLIAPHGEKLASVLDVQMADDREVEMGIGFGAMLKSVFSPPVRVWPS